MPDFGRRAAAWGQSPITRAITSGALTLAAAPGVLGDARQNELLRGDGAAQPIVAAELVGTGVQNLRAYEAHALLDPQRTEGGPRRYSADDLNRLRRITDLLEAGLNLAGIALVIQLQDENEKLRRKRK